MILNDRQIFALAITDGMIQPFTPELVRRLSRHVVLESRDRHGNVVPIRVYDEPTAPCISYGLSSYGYDIRLSPKDFRIFRHIPGTVINPKAFNPDNLVSVELHSDMDGSHYFILPGHSYGLGVALEKLVMPRSVTAIAIGKSTYARVGIIANLTPIESMWEGYLTLELSNSSNADCRIYANEGVCQLLFFKGEDCFTSYSDRSGKYQNQAQEVTLAKV
jgi:dCTP deaminase